MGRREPMAYAFSSETPLGDDSKGAGFHPPLPSHVMQVMFSSGSRQGQQSSPQSWPLTPSPPQSQHSSHSSHSAAKQFAAQPWQANSWQAQVLSTGFSISERWQ